MTEYWDGYREDGTLAGVTLVRGEPLPDGIFHLVSEILVRHTDGDYLLMQRSYQKQNYGGFFEATAGGSALQGEDSRACAIRELREETGIISEELHFIGRFCSRDTIYDEYLCITAQDKNSVRLQEGETVGFKWVSEGEFVAFIHSGKMIDRQKVRYMPFFLKMGYL